MIYILFFSDSTIAWQPNNPQQQTNVSVSVSSVWGVSSSPNLVNPNMPMQSGGTANTGNNNTTGAGNAGAAGTGNTTTGGSVGSNLSQGSQFDPNNGQIKQMNNQQGLLHSSLIK